MTDEKIKLIIGSLLHDIGKVVYREGDDRRNHSISGYDFLKENGGIDDKEILSCVRYHHISALKAAKMQENDLAYIVYLADNIAAFADRRKKEGEDVSGFDLSVPLQSIFNILNENDQEYYYLPGDMEDKGNVNYPTPEKRSFSKEFYMKIRQRMLDNFKGMEWNDEYLNSLLAVMEANLTYVPSSTSKGELSDAVKLFYEQYYQVFQSKFPRCDRGKPNTVFLGGGSGFVSKTVVYPMFGEKEGIEITKDIFDRTGVPQNHKHYKDTRMRVSPHILKCTRYQGKEYMMGQCEIDIS